MEGQEKRHETDPFRTGKGSVSVAPEVDVPWVEESEEEVVEVVEVEDDKND